MLHKYTVMLRTFRQIIRQSLLCRQLYQVAHRTHSHHHYYKHGRRWWDRRILLAFVSAAGFSFAEHGIPDERYDNKAYLHKEFVHCRRVPGKYEMYEYKCVGTYYDISPNYFLDVQNELAFRKEWDSNVMRLELLKEEDEHELIRWVQKYPYPLYPREYVYARRTWVSEDSHTVIVDSEVVPTHLVPGSPKNVRVTTYRSRMAVRSHKEFDDHGLDFVLTYFDNPEANIPRYVYNWMVNHGGPYFLRQVHGAAKDAERSGRKLTWTSAKMAKYRHKVLKGSQSTLISEEEEEEEEVDESLVTDTVPPTSKTRKFTFTSVDTNLPAETYVNA
ncbi:START domain-containing protein [Trichostrongylus colubriformis]|uniref:Phosphatidylcholine transfer protein n=1 Tax=Trichostrongylus colubriformis TaxID=6319 RepID=A0AAN8IEI7_TRICO